MIICLIAIGTYFATGGALGNGFMLAFFLAYVFCCAISISAIVFVLLSEMYQNSIRGRAMSLAGFMLWVGTYLVGQLTPVLLAGRKVNYDMNRTFNIENEINNYRNQLKSQNINDINDHAYTYEMGTIYMDIISECEKLGDYVVNVVEARMGTKKMD